MERPLTARPLKIGPPQTRLMSLDALRGFDMFWIIGARGIADGLRALGLPGAGTLANQLTHAGWNGFTFYDLIFPLFIFMTGVSLVFAIRSRLERGEDRRTIFRHVLWRTALLFLLGVFYNGGASQPLENLRVMGVLQRIALTYFFASALVLTTDIRKQAAVAVSILIGYLVLLRFVPVPGHAVGVLTPTVNMVRLVDLSLLPGQPYWDTWGWDPEGILSTVPAIATGLLGVLAGHWLRAERGPRGRGLTGATRAGYLGLGGAAGVALGLVAGLIIPINKPLWTSSYVLLSGGLSAMLLALFYWLIDVRGYRKWAFPFVVIGLNSVFIYLAAAIVPFDAITRRLVGGSVSTLFGPGRVLFEALAQLLVQWMVLFWMYRRKAFVKV